ncbi:MULTISPECIES: hypothetical protein [unclassified Frondihabitans]|nr:MULTISPECIES: hypothetical protein [unclassified Frondihabitans]RPE77624.1 hypothetical protein EDF37_0271 [Frondihabitans sp. PhB153]RPF07901.1 hypothetical protein EDF39_0272 [Frondihabitans sp. PhB161]
MIRLLKYLPVVLSIVSVIRKTRKDAALKNSKSTKGRRTTFRK